jgi:alkanesulfonate monooxygenase SsuD/methylene tetrahydromethanopterin reductase-like flavin-dependent oxidoreductase (luciferase family)
MQFGIVFPFYEIHDVVALAREAESAGWDGLFVGDGIWTLDPWVTLAAVATQTQRLRIGTLLTPVSRRRPWKLATETATLDRLSNGRLIMAVGLGALDTGFKQFGEQTDRKTRAELLDEGLDIVTGLWKGQPFTYEGKHYRVRAFRLPHPAPVQSPRIPIWVVGAWPRKKSIQRALRWDGLLPAKAAADGNWWAPITPDDIREMKTFIQANRTQTTPFDIVIEGKTPIGELEQGVTTVQPLAEAGATWWIESLWEAPDLDYVRTRIRQGPPRAG